MAIHNEQIREVQGFAKEIEASALGMILDNLQVSQYQYPQKSTVRELVSNSLDAIKEKQIALSILQGKEKVEDYYITRNEPLYKDSNFDPSYYDPKWLWVEGQHYPDLVMYQPDTAYVTYVETGELEKDKLIIQDFGVGLGGKRLEGYFKLGWSSKRNNKSALGKYGIGAKAALSAASYFVMTTRYNGREYAFQIYNHNIVSIVPPFDMELGTQNQVHVFENGELVYYRDTDLPNGTTIEVEAKKHHKQSYIEAVKSQLLYFPNVEFRIRNKNGGTDVIPIQANILYEDEYIVLSDNSQYSKPHLLINKVNYGYVDFRELELEDMQGNIGIKVQAEEVDVNPSRESVTWNEKTRNTVMESFKKVVGTAERMISEQLKVPDFIEWIKACAEINSRYSNSESVLGRLSKIVSLDNAKISYSEDPRIRYTFSLLHALDMRTNRLEIARVGSTVKYKVKREETFSRDFAEGLPVIVQTGRSSFLKDKYLLQQVYPGGFISIRLRQVSLVGEDEDTEEPMGVWPDYLMETITKGAESYDVSRAEFKEILASVETFITHSKHIIPYSTIVVPEDFDGKEEVEEETEEVKEEMSISRAERRKLAGTIPLYTPRVCGSGYEPKGKDNLKRIYEWQKVEIPVVDIDEWTEDEIFYATDKVIGQNQDGTDILESSLLHLAAMITRPFTGYSDYQNPGWRNLPDGKYEVSENEQIRCTHFFDPDNKSVKLIKVAQERRKYFGDFKPIQRFFLDIKNKTLTMSNALIRWNTARVMLKHFRKLEFLENFELFHREHCHTYRELKSYVETNFRSIKALSKSNEYYGINEQSNTDLIQHCDKVMKLQLAAREYKDKPELVAKVVQELFNPEQEIIDGCAIDIKLYDRLMELVEYATPVYTLLNEISTLTHVPDSGNPHKPIAEQLEHDIKEYLEFKGVAIQ
jgi:hypothetical protein